MTGASDTLDPIAAAEAGIAGSKHLIASVADDLSQQERWLAHYRMAERRRARRVRFQGLVYRLELRWRHLTRWSRRLALTCLRLAHAAAAFLWRTAVALFLILRRAAVTCFLWLRPRVYALMLALAAWLTASLAWTLIQARALARAARRGAAIGAVWAAQQSCILAMTAQRWLSAAWAWTQIEAGLVARNSLNGAAIGSSWIAAKSRAGALSLQDELVHLASWTNKKAGHLSRASLATASLGFSWAKPNGQPASANHRALVTRRCTALISFEPRRARLPAIRLSATRAVSSDADRASP